MYKILTNISIIFILLISIAACSNNSNTNSDTTSDTKGEKVKLVWWSHDNAAFVKANKQFIADYQKLNPNVEIDLQIFPYEAMTQKLKAAYAGNNAPDIAQVFGSWAPQYAKNDLLSPVPESMKDWVKSSFYEPALGAYTFEDTIYGIPHEYNLENGGILANPAMFEEAGLSHPTTWEELINTAKELTVTEGDKISVKGFDFISGDNITFTLLSLILQQNGNYLTEDGHVVFSTPEAITAMEELKKFVTEYKVTDMRDFGGDTDTSDLFFKKKAAMVIRGPWTIAVGKENYEVEELDYISMPSFTENPPSFAAETGWGEIVAKSSKNQEEAWKFVQYMAEKEQAKYFNVTTFTVPANKEVAEDPSFVEELPKMKASLDVLPHGKFIGHLDTDFFKKQVNDVFQLIVAEKMSVEDGLNKIETEVNKMIDKQ